MKASLTISVGWMPMPKKRSQPLLPVSLTAPKGMSDKSSSALRP